MDPNFNRPSRDSDHRDCGISEVSLTRESLSKKTKKKKTWKGWEAVSKEVAVLCQITGLAVASAKTSGSSLM